MDEDWPRLADYVVNARVRRGYDLRRFATRITVSERTLGKLEAGERVGRDTLAAVEIGLGWKPGSCRTILRGGEPDEAGEAPGPQPGYPDFVGDDPYFRHIWDYPGGDVSEDEKEYTIMAIELRRESDAKRRARRRAQLAAQSATEAQGERNAASGT